LIKLVKAPTDALTIRGAENSGSQKDSSDTLFIFFSTRSLSSLKLQESLGVNGRLKKQAKPLLRLK
jgi:hypothetical protein